MLVRDAEPDDAEGLGYAYVTSWRQAYEDLIPADFLANLSVSNSAEGWRRRLIGPDPRSRRTSVAIEADRVVGLVMSGPDDDEPSIGHVLLIYALREVWGSGVGAVLMTAGVDSLRGRGFHEAILWVLEENHRARRFYEKTGWSLDAAAHQEHDFGGALLTEVRYSRAL